MTFLFFLNKCLSWHLLFGKFLFAIAAAKKSSHMWCLIGLLGTSQHKCQNIKIGQPFFASRKLLPVSGFLSLHKLKSVNHQWFLMANSNSNSTIILVLTLLIKLQVIEREVDNHCFSGKYESQQLLSLSTFLHVKFLQCNWLDALITFYTPISIIQSNDDWSFQVSLIVTASCWQNRS